MFIFGLFLMALVASSQAYHDKCATGSIGTQDGYYVQLNDVERSDSKGVEVTFGTNCPKGKVKGASLKACSDDAEAPLVYFVTVDTGIAERRGPVGTMTVSGSVYCELSPYHAQGAYKTKKTLTVKALKNSPKY